MLLEHESSKNLNSYCNNFPLDSLDGNGDRDGDGDGDGKRIGPEGG